MVIHIEKCFLFRIYIHIISVYHAESILHLMVLKTPFIRRHKEIFRMLSSLQFSCHRKKMVLNLKGGRIKARSNRDKGWVVVVVTNIEKYAEYHEEQ